MIITKDKPFTKAEIKKLRECFDVYIKTVLDVEKKICSAGCDRHFESEEILLDQESTQSNIWGGGIDLKTKILDCKAFINIRPNDNNTSDEIKNPQIRHKFLKLMKYFFKEVL